MTTCFQKDMVDQLCDDRAEVLLYLEMLFVTAVCFRFEFEEFEHVTDLKYVALKSEGTVSGLKGYISVCTNFSHGEEVTSRGKVHPSGKHLLRVNYYKVDLVFAEKENLHAEV